MIRYVTSIAKFPIITVNVFALMTVLLNLDLMLICQVNGVLPHCAKMSSRTVSALDKSTMVPVVIMPCVCKLCWSKREVTNATL